MVLNEQILSGKEKLISDISETMTAAASPDGNFKSLSSELKLSNDDSSTQHLMKVADATIKTLKVLLLN